MDGPLIDSMHVEVEQGKEDPNWCSTISGALGGVAGVLMQFRALKLLELQVVSSDSSARSASDSGGKLRYKLLEF